jgi:aryl-alcohol dehydrogenase-like predicted oxidoreductase
VSGRLGLGTGRLDSLAEGEAFALLDLAWSLGVRLFDTAPSYGRAEELLGKWISSRRVQPRMSTKVGYGVPGVPDWTGPCVAGGIDRARALMGVARLEVVHLHSCPGAVALRDDLQRALEDAVKAGKVRVAAYSGENEDLDAALSSPLFQGVQLSVSPWDQGSRELRLPAMKERGLLVLAKRPLAGAPWAGRVPQGSDEAEYARRFAAMALPEPEEGWDSFALRFSAFSPGVTMALVGTTSGARLRAYAEALARGPLPQEEVEAVARRWRETAAGWRGVV